MKQKIPYTYNIQRISQLWGLRDLVPIKNGHVFFGLQKDLPVILKLYSDGQEAVALRAFSGYGVVSFLDQTEGALLLECAVPGTSLKSYFPDRDLEAIQITCNVIKKLHQVPIPKDVHFPRIDAWLSVIDQAWDIPMHYLEKARILKNQLLATASKPVLLHGDLHHDNILLQGNDWLVIDPKGVIGESAYEIAAFIRNPIPELLQASEAKQIIATRIHEFSRILKIDAHRIEQWCFVQAVLAWIWSIEDGYNVDYFNQFCVHLDNNSNSIK